MIRAIQYWNAGQDLKAILPLAGEGFKFCTGAVQRRSHAQRSAQDRCHADEAGPGSSALQGRVTSRQREKLSSALCR